MDSRAQLDYALFQLTPTRTRCDLVLFSGGVTEKLASGLLEPFLTHLKFAKDQIPKGGYSITLRPPSDRNPSWFTKATFQRFVRFVCSPEVLERFVTIETEILQIENSVQSNELSNTNVAAKPEEENASATIENTKKSTDSLKLKGELEGNDGVAQEENSKVRLQRLLETRKGLLRKEQAMSYARALVAGFEMADIDDLISFSDSFGASRLREACINFKELCKKKHSDGRWMDELAAMEACSPSELPFMGTSGIVLTSESIPNQNIMLNFHGGLVPPSQLLDASVSDSTTNNSTSDTNKDNNASDQTPSTPAKVQLPMSWPNQIPQYMYNFQGPGQQMPPYPGYMFPGMQPVPPYYPGNMQWPQSPNIEEPNHRRSHKSSSGKKEYSPNGKVSETSDNDAQTESSDSESRRTHRKKSSRTVVIRNINYITSKRRDGEKDEDSEESSSQDEEFIDGDSLKQKIEDAVESSEKQHKSSRKKRSTRKSLDIVNGSNGSEDPGFENNPVSDASEGRKTKTDWDAFQSLLMRDEDSVEKSQPIDVRNEHFSVLPLESVKGVQRKIDSDSFVVNERSGGNEGKTNFKDFENGEKLKLGVRRSDVADGEVLFSSRFNESVNTHQRTQSDLASDSSMIKKGSGEDWFIVNHSGKSDEKNGDYSLPLESNSSRVERTRKEVLIDDSCMIQTRSTVENEYYSHWKTDINVDSDLTIVGRAQNPDASKDKVDHSGSYEPDDLYMVLERDPKLDSNGGTWSPKMDYGIDISFTESDRRSSGIKTEEHVEEKTPPNTKVVNGKKSVEPRRMNSVKETKSSALRASLGKAKSDIAKSQMKKPTPLSRASVQKSKLDKEEETRRKMEELVIQRQMRIAQRSAADNKTSTKNDKLTTQDSKRLSSRGLSNASSTTDRPGVANGQSKFKAKPAPLKAG